MPPFVLISVFIFVISSIESLHISINSWLVVKYGSPECFQVISYFAELLLSIFIIVSLISLWFVSVEYLILNAILILPGITLSTPVPLFILDIWKEVGGKYLLPLSNLIFKKSEIILELMCIGFSAFSGYATWPCIPWSIKWPVIEPLRPFLITSPILSEEEGSPTKQ